MKKIAIFQRSLSVGGIQRSLVNILNSNILDNCYVDVFLFSRELFYDISNINNNINIIYLDPFPYWYRFIPFNIIRKVKKCELDLKSYDYIVDFNSYSQECAFYATQKCLGKRIMWIHSNIIMEHKNDLKFKILYMFFKPKYKYYDEYVAVSEGAKESFVKMLKLKNKKITVVPNIIDVDYIHEKSKMNSDVLIDQTKINIVCVGRLCLAKGYELLLRDFKKASQINDNLRLYIIGDGEKLESYRKWVRKNHLDSKIFFVGAQKNPFSIMKNMDAFCIESRYEGQGMVLLEAKALGLPLIFPKRLEKFNYGIIGSENVINALCRVDKIVKKNDNLEEYHNYVRNQMEIVFDLNRG